MLIPATDSSCVYEVRRTARELSRRLGFAEEDGERVAIVATELTSNVVKHARSGEIFAQLFDDMEGRGVEIVALDSGPGIADLARAMGDGHSTAGTRGNGLGAISRLADIFRIYSRPGLGTAALARFLPKSGRPPPSGRATISGLARPISGETECGDAFSWSSTSGKLGVMLADGLGHGPLAARAANAAVEAFRHAEADGTERAISAIHAALSTTRGAAIAVAHILFSEHVVEYGGIGNISGAVVEKGHTRRMMTEHGTAGHIAGRIRTLRYPFASSPLVILHSDGLKSGWDLASYPGLSEAHPALVAGILMRDFRRGRDDASVVAVRWSFER